MAFTDQQLLNQIQYHMIETPDSGATWASGLWTQAEVVRYANQRQDRLLAETAPYVTDTTISIINGTGSYTLPAGFISALSVIFTPTGGDPYELSPSDTFEADHGIPDWDTVSHPKVYYTDPTLVIGIAPIPDSNGSIELQYVATGTNLTGSGASLTAQDEMVPTIKYGIMADMLSKVGRAHDPIRAQYCDERYEMGIEAVKALINGFVQIEQSA